MKSVSFSEVSKALCEAHHILVAAHARPDGDALGSTLAAALWLKNQGHQVTVWNEDGLPAKYSYLPESSLVSKPVEEESHFDAILVLDTATKERLGKTLLAVAHAPLWVAIDHHVSNEYFADLNFVVPGVPATGQILTESFLCEKIEITPAMASNLYVAISTDTGSFQYEGTTARTFEIAAALVRSGVDVALFSKAMYENQPKRRLDLLKHALVNTKFLNHDQVASFALSLKDATSLSIMPEDTEGIIDYLRSVESVKVAAFFEELPDGKVRLSLRSKDRSFDACALCRLFGGGGHIMAAGARIEGSLSEVESRVLEEINKELGRVL